MFGWQDGFAAPVGSFPAGHTPTGLQDMAGNVSEWVSELITPTDGMTNRVHGVRGGAWSTVESAAVQTTNRDAVAEGDQRLELGFRCASAVR